MPGVRTAESMRVVPAKMRFGSRESGSPAGLPAVQELSYARRLGP
jgi:hypothetical protein